MNLRGIAAILGLVALVGVVVILFDRHWQISVPYTGVVKGYQFFTIQPPISAFDQFED